MANFDSFRTEWLGRRVADPLLVGHGETVETMYQCVSLIKQYLLEVSGIKVDWPGNAIDFWYHTDTTILQHFTKHNDIQKGDIVVLYTLGHNDATQPGHIGIATGNGDPNSIEILEQNGLGSGTGLGRDAISTRFVARNRVAGTLRPIPVAQALPMWTLDPNFTPKQVKTNKSPTHKWGMNWDFNYMKDHPVAERPINDVFTAVAKVLHSSGNHYYRDNMDDANAYAVADCDDYAPPAPVITITPPAAPVPIPKAEKYSLITTVMAFDSPEAAQMHNGTAKPLGPGEYYVRDKKTQAWNLSTDNMKDQNKWINIQDNVEAPAPLKVVPTLSPKAIEVITSAAKDIPVTTAIEVVPAPPDESWKQSKSFFNVDGSPEYFYSINTADMAIADLSSSNNAAVNLHPLTRHIPIVATYEKDGLLWGLPQNSYDRGNLYLIPLRVLKLEKKSFTEVIEEAINDLRIADRFNQTKYRVSKFIDGLKDTRAGKK